MKRLQVRSAIVVPILVMKVPVAIAAFMMTTESSRRYGPDDLALAQEMARRIAPMLENALLHRRLRHSEERFRVALEHANISVVETDAELRIRWIYDTRLGVPETALIGMTASEALGSQIGGALDEVQRCVLETGAGARRVFSAFDNGRTHYFLVHYEPLRSAAGIDGLIGTTIDVTELKEAEEQLARELGFRERMMGILGHDLRNPVSAVLGLTRLMGAEASVSDKARELLGVIEQAARRMNEMIGTLLDFTRLRARGALPVEVEDTNLDEVVRDVVAELRAAHRKPPIEVEHRGSVREHGSGAHRATRSRTWRRTHCGFSLA